VKILWRAHSAEQIYSSKSVTLHTISTLVGGFCIAATVFEYFYKHHNYGALFWGLLSAGQIMGFVAGALMQKYDGDDAQLLMPSSGEASNSTSSPSPSRPELDRPYLDPSHPRYSAKLAAAILTWEAMEDESLRKGKMPMAAMTNWLEKLYAALGLAHKRGSDKHGYNAGDINKTAIAEVSKICNWEVDGGPPPTPGS